MSDKIITIALMETVLDETVYAGIASIAIQENNQDTIELIKQEANGLVVGTLEDTCQSAMIVDDSGIKLIAGLMKQVEDIDWSSCLYCFVNPPATTVMFSVEHGDKENSTLSSDLSFIVTKSDVVSVKNKKAVTVEGMTKYLDFSR